MYFGQPIYFNVDCVITVLQSTTKSITCVCFFFNWSSVVFNFITFLI